MYRVSFALALFLTILGHTYAQQTPPASLPHSGPGGTAEYWDVPSLSASALHPLAPIVGEKAVLPGFTRELVRVEWRFGDPIDLYIIRPIGVASPPVVLFLYGYPTDTDRFLSDKLCATITAHGFAAAGFVSALTGARYHDRPMKQWFISELQESLGTSIHDVQMVINYLGTRGDLDMQQVGIFGQGSGGTIAIISAAVDPRIKAVDVIDPWGDWPDWLAKSPQVPEQERARYLTPAFLAGVAPLDPLRWMSHLGKRPFRMQETLFNLVTPEQARVRLTEALSPQASLVKYQSREDYVRRASERGRILDWLQQQLVPAPHHSELVR